MGRSKFRRSQDRGEIKRDKINKSLGLLKDWRRPITPADLVAWRQNLTERFGDLDAATETARRTVLNSTFWAGKIRSMA